MNVFEFLLMLAAEVTDGAVVDGAAGDQPHEIDRVSDLTFERSRTADAADHCEQQDFAQAAGMDRRLAEFSIVRVFSRGPVESVENFVEQPDRMVFRDFLFETGWNEEDLISRARRRLPVASID